MRVHKQRGPVIGAHHYTTLGWGCRGDIVPDRGDWWYCVTCGRRTTLLGDFTQRPERVA